MATRRTQKTEPTPFTFEVDGEKYEMPPFDPALYQPRPVSLAEAARNRAELGREGYEFDNLLTRFGEMQLALEKHLTDDAHAPSARAIARMIDNSAEHGYREFFEFFNAWVKHDGSEVITEPGESAGSQVS
jgi:hypothetical protein